MTKIFDYKCKKCGKTHEYWVENGKLDENCKSCDAPPSELERLPTWRGTRHGSWGRWHV